MWLNCAPVARHMGKRHNQRSGIAPLKWLEQFARALNRGSGLKLRDRSLPLHCFRAPGDSQMQVYMVRRNRSTQASPPIPGMQWQFIFESPTHSNALLPPHTVQVHLLCIPLKPPPSRHLLTLFSPTSPLRMGGRAPPWRATSSCACKACRCAARHSGVWALTGRRRTPSAAECACWAMPCHARQCWCGGGGGAMTGRRRSARGFSSSFALPFTHSSPLSFLPPSFPHTSPTTPSPLSFCFKKTTGPRSWRFPPTPRPPSQTAVMPTRPAARPRGATAGIGACTPSTMTWRPPSWWWR